MKVLRSLISGTLALSLCMGSIKCKSVTAASYTRLIDNDPIATGYSGQYANMSYYNGLVSSYNNDMRLSNSTSAYYMWRYPMISTDVSNCTVSLNIYLDNYNFTDTYAHYTIMTYPIEGEGAGYFQTIGYINQEIAPSGWSTISKNVSTQPGYNSIASSSVCVEKSTASGRQMGADAIQVTISY